MSSGEHPASALPKPGPDGPLGILRDGGVVLHKQVENAFLIGVPLLGSVLALRHIWQEGLSWIDASSFLIFYGFTGLGVALGLHRYFSHRSFEAKPWLVFLLGMAGSMSFQGPINRWVADHRRHHAHTDSAGDVHSPHTDPWGFHHDGLRGFVYAHIGWMLDRTATDHRVYGQGLQEDPTIRFFSKTYPVWLFLSLALPFAYGWALGGWQAGISSMLIGGCLRTTVLHNVIWAVNSVGHTFGPQNFTDKDNSTNNLVLALLSFGEGWHNNHHKFPRSYRHGLRSHELDVNGWIIERLERTGLVWNVVRIPAARIASEMSGAGSANLTKEAD